MFDTHCKNCSNTFPDNIIANQLCWNCGKINWREYSFQSLLGVIFGFIVATSVYYLFKDFFSSLPNPFTFIIIFFIFFMFGGAEFLASFLMFLPFKITYAIFTFLFGSFYKIKFLLIMAILSFGVLFFIQLIILPVLILMIFTDFTPTILALPVD